MRRQDKIPTVNADWWNYGGITRDVLLAEVSAACIADYKVQLAKGDRGRMEGYVQMAQCGEGQQVTVTIPEAGISKTVKTDAGGQIEALEPGGAEALTGRDSLDRTAMSLTLPALFLSLSACLNLIDQAPDYIPIVRV